MLVVIGILVAIALLAVAYFAGAHNAKSAAAIVAKVEAAPAAVQAAVSADVAKIGAAVQTEVKKL